MGGKARGQGGALARTHRGPRRMDGERGVGRTWVARLAPLVMRALVALERDFPQWQDSSYWEDGFYEASSS